MTANEAYKIINAVHELDRFIGRLSKLATLAAVGGPFRFMVSNNLKDEEFCEDLYIENHRRMLNQLRESFGLPTQPGPVATKEVRIEEQCTDVVMLKLLDVLITAAHEDRSALIIKLRAANINVQ